jgi:plastocyanin
MSKYQPNQYFNSNYNSLQSQSNQDNYAQAMNQWRQRYNEWLQSYQSWLQSYQDWQKRMNNYYPSRSNPSYFPNSYNSYVTNYGNMIYNYASSIANQSLGRSPYDTRHNYNMNTNQAMIQYVQINDYNFTPAMITVRPGTKVIWTNNSPMNLHTVTSDNGRFDSGSIATNGGQWEYTFNESGIFSYHCTPHPFMRGTVVVNSW